MKKIFIINGGQKFHGGGGTLNASITEWTRQTLEELGYQVQSTCINDTYDSRAEAEKIAGADVIIYHTPIWWFQLPYGLKQYIDEVFIAGMDIICPNDGRSREEPERNYGTGGLMQGKKYMVTTTWNAPLASFTQPNDFFDQTSVDNGVLFGFHKMNKFVGLSPLEGFHFYDVRKNGTPERIEAYKQAYIAHLKNIFGNK